MQRKTNKNWLAQPPREVSGAGNFNFFIFFEFFNFFKPLTSRIGLSGFFRRANEEELVYQAFLERKMKKN